MPAFHESHLNEEIELPQNSTIDWSHYSADKVYSVALNHINSSNNVKITKIVQLEPDLGFDFARGVQNILENHSNNIKIASLTLNLAIKFLSVSSGHAKYFENIDLFSFLKSSKEFKESESLKGKLCYLLSLIFYNPKFTISAEHSELLCSSILNSLSKTCIQKDEEINKINELHFENYTTILNVLIRNQNFHQYISNKLIRNYLGCYKNHSNTSVLYNLLLSRWILSFPRFNLINNDYRTDTEDDEREEIDIYVQILYHEPVLKIYRLILNILFNKFSITENLHCLGLESSDREREAEMREEEISEILLSYNFLRILERIKKKKSLMKDEDLIEICDFLFKKLIKNYKILTSFNKYENEIKNKKFKWKNSTHTSNFWKENNRLFEKNNFYLIKKLIELLKNEETDHVTKAIACFDLGQFSQFYPKGKLIIQNYGGKKEIFKLLKHEDVNVQKQALTACSKLMISNWQSII